MCTMQAPHRPVPQPNLVPVSFSPSRITHNNGVAGGASVDAVWPFTVKSIGIAFLLGPRGSTQPSRGAHVRYAVGNPFCIRTKAASRASQPVPRAGTSRAVAGFRLRRLNFRCKEPLLLLNFAKPHNAIGCKATK